MTKPQALITAFSVFLLVMVGAVVYMLISMSQAKADWVAQEPRIEADLNARFGNTISVTRLVTSEGLDEHITVDGMTTDCTAFSTPSGWNIECPEEILALLHPPGYDPETNTYTPTDTTEPS